MIFWLLYLAIDGTFLPDFYPHHFTTKVNCAKMGKKLVKEYKYEKYRCVKEIQE